MDKLKQITHPQKFRKTRGKKNPTGKKLIKIRGEINEIETKKQYKEKYGSFENVNWIDRLLVQLTN